VPLAISKCCNEYPRFLLLGNWMGPTQACRELVLDGARLDATIRALGLFNSINAPPLPSTAVTNTQNMTKFD
jgi:hypothetical protein